MFHEYPYTDFHELNLDYLMKLARESLGLHLDVQGKDLALVNAAGQNVSKVRVAFATTAEKDEEGNDIVAYVFDAGLEGRALVFTKGDGSSESIVIPFATTAEKDVNNKDITSYVSRVGVSGNKILVTFGDGTTYSFTCPYANKAGQAETDENGKNLTTYMADVEVSGNNLVFKDGEGVTLRTITVSYATEAGTAEKAAKDLQGNAFLSNYGYQLSIDGNKVGIDSHDGTTINKITVPFSTLSTDATNAIETVTINGNDIIFSTYGGQQFTITCPFAVKAQKDDLGNNIKNTYVANVTTNPNTGAITFLDAQGNTIVTITPTVDAATHDALGNTISDYVKAIAVSASSNYVTVTHGDGDVDTLTINYSTHAFKDLNNQSIHNTYCTLLACEEDVQDGHYKLVGYNGDVPVAEIFRITLIADAAKHDSEGNVISEFYGHSLDYDSTGDKVSLLDASGNVLSYINIDDAEGSIIENIVKDSNSKVEQMDIDSTTYDFAHTLDDLEDTDLYDKLGGQALMYNHQNQLWEPKYPHDTYYVGINTDIDPATWNNESFYPTYAKNQVSTSDDDFLLEMMSRADSFRWLGAINTIGPTGWNGSIALAVTETGTFEPTAVGGPNSYIVFQGEITEDAQGLYFVEIRIEFNNTNGTVTNVSCVGNRVDLASGSDIQYLDCSGGIGPTAQTMSWPQATVDLTKTLVLRATFNGKTVYIPEKERSGGYVNFYYADNMLYYYNSNSIYSMLIDKVISYNMAGGSVAWSISPNGTETWNLLVKANDTSGTAGGDLTSINLFGKSYTIPSGGGGGGSSIVVTLTGAYSGTTIDLAAMAPNSNITVNADSSYAAIKAADDIIFKITDTTPAGSKYTLRPTGVQTLNVAADQSLIFTFSVITPSSNTPKVFRLEVDPWSNAYTLLCIS